MKTSEKIERISKALIEVQKEVVDVFPDKKGYGYSYADLAQVLNVLRPLVTKNAMCIVQGVDETANGIKITTRILHESGEWIESAFDLPPTTLKGANEVQALGSSITYGRRYHLASMFGIATDKDLDGRLDGDREQPQQSQRDAPKTSAKPKPKQTPTQEPKANPSEPTQAQNASVDIKQMPEWNQLQYKVAEAKKLEGCISDKQIKWCEGVSTPENVKLALEKVTALINEYKEVPY